MLPNHILKKIDELNSIPYLNFGGCAFAALYIKQYLKKEGYKSTIYYLTRKDDKYEREQLRNNTPTSCFHAVVKVRNKFYDSNGEYEPTEYYRTPVSMKLVKKSLKNRYLWNRAFERSSVRIIKKILDIR